MLFFRFLLLYAFLITSQIFCQTTVTATFYEQGVNSPWTIGMDYDFGFGKFMSLNVQFFGGINSQVNRSSTFGEVFFGELQIGPRFYMNKIDTWNGLYLSTVARIGIYNVPIRTRDNPVTGAGKLIIDRSNMFLYGFGIYLGYRWTRNLMNDMSGLPFYLVLEPYLGWSLDFLLPLSAPDNLIQNRNAIHRFTVGLSFKIGFYTHKKSQKTLDAEAKQKEKDELEKKEENTQNTNSITTTY